VRKAAAWSLVGPGAFAVAAAIGARIEPGYRPRDEPISALAAHGTRSAPVMIPGFLGLALGSLGLARALRGSRVAPTPVPAMLTLSAVTVAGAGLARNSDRSCPTRFLGDQDVQPTDDAHAYTSMATFALWIALPLVAARRATGASPAYRRACRVLGWSTLATLLGGGSLARREDQSGSGTAQRVFLACAFGWFLLAGVFADRVGDERRTGSRSGSRGS
jgi:hypothetical protein